MLLQWRTVLDNVLLPAEILGLDRAAVASARAMDLLELVGLGGFETRFPRELSGGMQQRVSICRALIHNPSVLLMDEPFAALDAMTREELGFELLRIWDKDKKTVIFVTHNITEAILLADRVVAMSPRPGRIARVVEGRSAAAATIDMEFTEKFKTYSEQIRDVIYHGPGASRPWQSNQHRAKRRRRYSSRPQSTLKAILGATLTFIALVVRLGSSGPLRSDSGLAAAVAELDRQAMVEWRARDWSATPW